jgi:hypothetical protein
MTIAPSAPCSAPASTPGSARLWLQPGQARLLHLQAGDELFTAQGSLLLTAPAEGLGGPAGALRRTLHCGEGHALSRSAWVRLESGAQPALVLVATAAQQGHAALPACDPRPRHSPAAGGVWRFVQRLAAALANSAGQRQQMPS